MKRCQHCDKEIEESRNPLPSDRYGIRTYSCSYFHYLLGMEYCVIPQYREFNKGGDLNLPVC